MRISFFGVGKMGEAILAGVVARQGADGIAVVDHSSEQEKAVAERYQVSAPGAEQAAKDAEVLLVAVKPHDVPALLDELGGSLADGAVVVSIAAGTPLAVLEAHLPEGTAVVRVMPNTPAMVGQGMSALSPGTHVDEDQLARARELMEACGEIVVVPESQQDAVTAVSGSGPAYVFMVAEAMIEAGVQLGLARPVATQLANQTILGAGTMLVESGTHPSILRENVTSPGGTTAQALKVLDQHAVRAAFSEAMTACHDTSAAMAVKATAEAAAH